MHLEAVVISCTGGWKGQEGEVFPRLDLPSLTKGRLGPLFTGGSNAKETTPGLREEGGNRNIGGKRKKSKLIKRKEPCNLEGERGKNTQLTILRSGHHQLGKRPLSSTLRFQP